jgi:hypothetical protein
MSYFKKNKLITYDLVCEKCNDVFNYMSKEDYDRTCELNHNLSHSKELCRECHEDWLKEQNWQMLMSNTNFRTIPMMVKIQALTFGHALPSNICIVCGAKVAKDISHYNPSKHQTVFNRCDKCTQEEKDKAKP